MLHLFCNLRNLNILGCCIRICTGKGTSSVTKRESGHTYFGRKESLVVELVLDPRHQVVDVLGGGALDRLLDRVAVGPVVLVLGPGRHDRAAVFGAELGYRAVQHVDLIEKINR